MQKYVRGSTMTKSWKSTDVSIGILLLGGYSIWNQYYSEPYNFLLRKKQNSWSWWKFP